MRELSRYLLELSRYLLKEKGIDFAEFYRQRIANKQFLSGSLLGLSETGKSEDLAIFEQNIHSKKSKIVIACFAAINKFNPAKAKNYSLKLLVYPIRKVRNKAIEILAKGSNTATVETVRDIYAIGDYEIKKTILKLYNKIGGWNIIGDLLIARLFTTPSRAEIERAKKIYSTLDTSSLKMTYGTNNLLQDLKFYLRRQLQDSIS